MKCIFYYFNTVARQFM